MAITVSDIEQKEFAYKGAGYDPYDVDQYLDQICDEMVAMQDRIQQLEADLAVAKQATEMATNAAKPMQPAIIKSVEPVVAPAPVAKTSETLEGILLSAQKLADGAVEDAKRKAETIIKDAQDKLDEEIAKKFRRGYPQDNIVFSDDASVVLWQHRQEVMRCAVEDTAALEKLLKLFFGYERPEIASFRAAVAQFKSDLPAVLDSLRQMIDGFAERHDPECRGDETHQRFEPLRVGLERKQRVGCGMNAVKNEDRQTRRDDRAEESECVAQ